MTKECQTAFDTLRSRLMDGPILAIYDPTKKTELHCDASALGFGAVLLQKQPDERMHPVSYFSQAATKAEGKYHSFELETLAIIYALRRYQVYLAGIEFTVVTDCNALKLTLEQRQLNPRIARWAYELHTFDFKLIYRPGTSMAHVDALSRCHRHERPSDGTDKANGQTVDEVGDNILDRILAAVNTAITEENRNTDKKEDQTNDCTMIAAIDEDEISLLVHATQGRDKTIVRLRTNLEKRPVDNYKMLNGLVFRITDPDRPQLYVPTDMVDNEIRMIHQKI